jgi:site-specific DNA recombinase
VQLVAQKVKIHLKSSDQRHKEIRMQLQAVETKIENVENKLFTDVITDHTYKRSMLKFNAEKAQLQQEIENLDNFDDNIQQDLLVLPYMINLHQVYNDAPIGQKHAIVREVFKDGLTYKNGVFRTPSINQGLICNTLNLNKIGLLEIEQTYQFENSFSLCGERGIRTPGPMTVNSFQDCRIRPLCQLSAAKVQIPFDSANLDLHIFRYF